MPPKVLGRLILAAIILAGAYLLTGCAKPTTYQLWEEPTPNPVHTFTLPR